MQSASRNFYLHIGMSKTATTWLQDDVFPGLSHLHYAGVPKTKLFRSPLDASMFNRTLTCAMDRSSLIWRTPTGDAILDEIMGSKKSPAPPDRHLLASDEGISRTGARPEFMALHLREIDLKMRERGFTPMKVILCIRRQDRWLASHYAQMSDRNPSASQDDFAHAASKITDPATDRYKLGFFLELDTLYRQILTVVPKENLLILVYEALEENPQQFLRTMFDFMDAPADLQERLFSSLSYKKKNVRSASENSWQLRPPRTKSLRSRLRWHLGSQKIELTAEVSKKILTHYEESNRQLARETGLDLTRYGYF